MWYSGQGCTLGITTVIDDTLGSTGQEICYSRECGAFDSIFE